MVSSDRIDFLWYCNASFWGDMITSPLNLGLTVFSCRGMKSSVTQPGWCHISSYLYKAALNQLWVWLTDSLKPASTTYFFYLFIVTSQKLEMHQHDKCAINTPSHEITLSRVIHPVGKFRCSVGEMALDLYKISHKHVTSKSA